MAEIMSDSQRVRKQVRQSNADVDYSKYENTNRPRPRKISARVVPSGRLSVNHLERVGPISNSANQERSKASGRFSANLELLNKPTSNQERSYKTSSGRASANLERDFKSPTNQIPLNFKTTNHYKDDKFIQQRHISSSRKYEDTDKKLAQFRQTKSETKESHKTSRHEHKSKPTEILGPSRSASRQSPLHEIKRKLKFDEDEDMKETKPQTGLDFTDKIAALRTLIGKDRETRDITDRRAYYDEYKSSNKRIMISRTDSLKENGFEGDIKNGNVGDENSSGDWRRKNKERGRGSQSADIFKTKSKDGRISAVDLKILKGRLIEKRTKSREKEDSFRKEYQSAERTSDVNNIGESNDDSLVHATDGRKVLNGSAKKSEELHDLMETQQTVLRPSSRSGTRETQTSVLNQSIRSVQSNVPFFDNEQSQSKNPLQNSGRPSSALADNKGSVREKRKILCKVQDREGIEKGIKLTKKETNSPLRTSKITSPGRPSVDEGRQTNVDSFVGSSLTPEKDRARKSRTSNDVIALERLKEKISKISDIHDIDDKTNEKDIKHHHDNRLSRPESANKRPSSRPSSRNRELLKGDNLNSDKNQPKVDKHVKRIIRKKDFNNKNENDEFLDENFAKRIGLSTRKTDKKVREWIEQQESGALGEGQILIEELSVSVCLTPERKTSKQVNSPSDSCDKYPVKLPKSEKSDKFMQNPRMTDFESTRVGYVGDPRQMIHEKLDRISSAVTSEKKRLQYEVPVRDFKTGQRQDGLILTGESDSLESESSIFSQPFSIESGESMSSTIQAVKLLRKLYNVDTNTRQDLVLMAKCFRRWLNNVLYAKRRNLEITQAASRVSPISYGVMLRKGDICYRTTVLTQCWTTWSTALRDARLLHQVAALHRKHTLRKGMNAFRWAINRSQVQQGILQDRINAMLLAANFVKWKCRAVENRRVRLQQAFFRWRQYTKEAQKIRMLRNQTNRKLKQKLFHEWCERFQMRLKQHKADLHFRLVTMSHGWLSWQHYTMVTKEKKRRQSVAMQMSEGNVQKKMFTCMKLEFDKYQKAKQFHRRSQLKLAMSAWLSGREICREERADDARVAMVMWSRVTVRSYFVAWRDNLLDRRACRMSDQNITKHAFTTWSCRYQSIIKQRHDVDAYITRRMMNMTFRHWRMFVALMKRRREAAVQCIHAALQRHVIQKWRHYTKYQRDLRKRLQLYVYRQKITIQGKCLGVWRSQFKVKCDVQRAQQLWSNTCTRKAADKWRLVCHKRRLQRLLVETEPHRQLATQKVFFIKWRSRLGLIEDEKHEAADVRMTLDLSQLRLCYDKWKYATNQLLLIKPMVLRYRQRLSAQCFTEWRQYVQHKSECTHSKEAFIKVQLANKFAAWRRQYKVHQLEKEFNKRLVQNQARRCLQGWHFVIKRKHSARQFHEQHVLRSVFYTWKTLAVRQLRQKTLQQMEKESVMSTLREYFDCWRDRVSVQQSQAEEGETYLQLQQNNNRVKAMFCFWRRHFRATLVARENEKMRIRRVAKVALQEWHRYTQGSLHDAVERFAAAIGLHRGAGDGDVDRLDGEMDNRQIQAGDTDELLFEPMNFDADLVPHSTSSPMTPRTPRTPYTPHTPRHASSYGTPLKRLFSPPLSRQSLAQSLDFDSGTIISSSFLDARFEMEHAVKTESKREIVVTAVTRLRNWPISVMFELWKEHTARQRELKLLTTQMISVHERLTTARYLKGWVHSYKDMQLAKQHYDQVLQHKALLSLLLYRNTRRQKKHASHVAQQHYARNVYCKLFPMWFTKAQDKHHKEHIVHLWTNITAEERELIPRERSFRYQLNKKSVTQCFTVWLHQYRCITKLKLVYHRILLKRYMTAWSEWALEKHERKVKCQHFKDTRIKTLVFKTWCLRHKQKTEVARRYDDTWHNYLGVIVTAWCRWAKDQRKRKLMASCVVATQERHLVTRMFSVWKSSTDKQIRIQKWYESRLAVRSLCAWRDVATWQKDLRERQQQCQLVSYTILAKRAFSQWRACYLERLAAHKRHEQKVQRGVLRIATIWRRKAQVSRGKLLQQYLHKQQMKRSFTRWKSAYGRHLERVDILEMYLHQKHQTIVSVYLGTWHTELLALQAHRVYNMRLMVTLVQNWKLAAKACKQRRNCLEAHLTQKSNMTQKCYFLYWYNVAKARKSIRGHANLKIQLSVFKAWLMYTRKQRNLRRIEAAFTKRRNQRILVNYWYLIKTRFDYCVELSDMAAGVIQEKNTTLMRQALGHWYFRLQIVIADECHIHLLVKRVVTRWRRFVCRQHEERQRMSQLMDKATHWCHTKLCNKVYRGWYNEVLVRRHLEKRKARLMVKYGHLWKHKVDMVYTARCVREEHLYMLVWQKWHQELVIRRTIKKVEAFEGKQKLTMIFIAWKRLAKRKSRRYSMIPLPVSPAVNMPSASTSSSSTPTEEICSPTMLSRPTQIPLPSSGTTRIKSKIPSANSGTTTPTSLNSGRSTPTGPNRKPSFGY